MMTESSSEKGSKSIGVRKEVPHCYNWIKNQKRAKVKIDFLNVMS